MERDYLEDGRLADIVALMQVLAFDKYTRRSEEGLEKELQGGPISGSKWINVAQKHPEFFRVAKESIDGQQKMQVSLVSRYVSDTNDEGKRPPLSVDYFGTLVRLAVDIYDRAAARRDRTMPIIVASIAFLGAVIGGWLGHYAR